MNSFWILITYEWRHFKAAKGLVLLTSLMLLVGLYGIYYGTTEIQRQRQHLAELPTLAQHNVAELKVKFPAEADAGEIGYYHTTYAVHHPTPWASLSLGQRDVNPYYVKLRLLGLQGQLHASENVNPAKVLSGNFDLAFVLVYLFPLFITALSFNVLSSEKEQGILPLLLAQPVPPAVVVAAKLAFRLGVVLVLVLGLSVVAMLWAEVPLDSRVAGWLALVVLYCLFWFGVAFLITAWQRNSAFNAVALVGVWLLLVVLVPGLLNVYVTASRPVPQGIELTVKQREEIHGGWDKPKTATMNRFFALYPQWRDTATIKERFVWRWYYAFQHLGDKSVEPLVAAYTIGLRQRYELVESLSWLSPAINAQTSLNALAGTDLPAHLAFQQSATRYHDALREFYYPCLFNKVAFTHADYAKEPTHTFTSSSDTTTAVGGLWKLLLTVGVVYIGGLLLFRQQLVRPR